VANPAIPGPGGEPAFEVGEELSIYEAACVYRDTHPRPKQIGDLDLDEARDCSVAEGLMGLRRDRLSGDGRNNWTAPPEGYKQARRAARDAYLELIEAVKSGRLEPVRAGFFGAGDLNPFRTFIWRRELIDLAKKRGDAGTIVKTLIAEADLAKEHGDVEAIIAETNLEARGDHDAEPAAKVGPQTKRAREAITHCYLDGVPVGLSLRELRRTLYDYLKAHPVGTKGMVSDRVLDRELKAAFGRHRT